MTEGSQKNYYELFGFVTKLVVVSMNIWTSPEFKGSRISSRGTKQIK